MIKRFYVASGATYGSPWIHRDMREAGETCSVHRVARILKANKLEAQIGYKRRYIKGGKLASVADNHLDRNFSPDAPNRVWVSDITYGAPSLRKLLWKMLSGLEHVWNASRTTLEETNWMPALCYGRA